MTLDDLIAARIIDQERPNLRPRLLLLMQDLKANPQGGGEGFRTLLGELLRSGALSREQTEWVDDACGRHKRSRALGVYVEVLVREASLARESLEATVKELGGEGDCAALSATLLESKTLDAERAAGLEFQARRIFDADCKAQLQSFGVRRQAEVAQTLVGGEQLEAKIPSGVYREELVLPTSEEMTLVVDRASLRQDLAPPRFSIPSWVDTCEPLVGQRVGGFRILGLIGRGAMAKVYLADHADHEQPIALKLLPPEASAERRARFRREILANGFFSHESVIDLYDAGVASDGYHYLAMEFFEGTDLQQVLDTEGSISLRQSLSLIRQLLQALVVAHQAGIVHRDIKPGNIMVSGAGNTAKLTDFGIALIQELGDFKDKVFESDDGGITGTPEYLSPEQAFRDPVGTSSDLYSVGMVLFRCLAGRLPFQCESIPSWVNAHISETPLSLAEAAPDGEWPPALLELFERLFEKDPKKRIQTASEVLSEIDAIFLDLSSGRRSRFFEKVRRGF
ncbi:MAG: serine/threonine protein kinase [Planctomycetes bacterium]|nr:serine/threonine protein kinase [Planctomycetota bacterium]